MSADPDNPKYEYVAYIDEAGDLGLKRLRPLVPTGASEWFILAGVVMSRANEMAARDWVSDMLEATRGKQQPGQRQTLHFRNLSDAHQSLVCATLATLPVRCFVVASHKKSLMSWRASAGLIHMNNRDWYYNYLSRILLERMTRFVAHNSVKVHQSTKRLQVVFSERNGLNTGQIGVYLERLKSQSRHGTMVLKRGNLEWDTFDASLLRRANHKVSAYCCQRIFQGLRPISHPRLQPKFAYMLDGAIAREPDRKSGLAAGFGLKVLPEYQPQEWLPIQSKVFAHFGYPKEWWAPAPSTPTHG